MGSWSNLKVSTGKFRAFKLIEGSGRLPAWEGTAAMASARALISASPGLPCRAILIALSSVRGSERSSGGRGEWIPAVATTGEVSAPASAQASTTLQNECKQHMITPLRRKLRKNFLRMGRHISSVQNS
jgi:hypothetical protein